MANYDLGTIGYTVQNTGAPKSIAELKEFAQAGLEAHKNTTQLSQGDRLSKYFSSVDRQISVVNRNMQNYNRFISQAGQNSGRFGVVTQQAGYQIGDFLVQVQSGTNWMVAFGQQATQLVGILPLMGAGFMGLSTGALVALSAGLGIIIPLVTAVGAAFMRMGDDTKVAESSINAVDEALKRVQQTSENMRLEGIGKILGISNEEVILAEDLVSKEAERLAILQSISEIQNNAVVVQGMYDVVGAIDLYNQEQKLETLQEQLKKNEETLATLKARNYEEQFTNAMLARQEAYYTNLGNLERERVALANQYHASMIAVQNAHKIAAEQSKLIADRASEAGVSATQLSHISFDNISGAATEALRLAGNLGISLDVATKLAALGPQGIGGNDPSGKTYSGRGGAPSRGAIAELIASQGSYITPPSGSGAGGGGGGGGGGNARLDTLIEQLRTEREVLEEWYTQSQETLMSASENELQIIGGYNEAKLRLEQEYQERLKGIRGDYNNQTLTETASLFGQLANIASAGGQKSAKAVAVFQAIEGTINAYGAAIKALNTPGLGLAGRFAAYASVLAAGLKGVSAIRSAGGIGGGSAGSGGGGRGSATVAPTSAASTPQTVFIDSIDPKSLYSGETLINLFEAFYDENDRRGKVFVVAR